MSGYATFSETLQQHKIFLGTTPPSIAQDVVLGDHWTDTTGTPTLKIATSVSPVTWSTISGGGGGDVATDLIWDAKGDLAIGAASDSAARLAVGTNGQVLTADSAETLGVKWSTISGTGTVTNTGGALTSDAPLLGAGGNDIKNSTFSNFRSLANLVIGTDVQAYDATLAALSSYNTNGIITQTAADTFAGRSIAAGIGLAVSNGDGVSGNPTVALDIPSLTNDASPDIATDYLATYDNSATTHKKVLIQNLPYETTTQLNTRDTNNRARANHTGTQVLSTISDAGALAALSTVGTTQIDNDAVTNAKLANVSADTIKGRITGGSGDPEDLTASQVRTIINVADGANNYTHPNHSGDVTSSGDGATTIANDAVTNAKLANIATSTIKGRATAGTGDPEDLTASQVRTIINVADGANNYSHPNHSGDVTSSGDGATTIANDAVTNTKLANMATATIKGRATAGTGDPEDLTASGTRTLLSLVPGTDVQAYDATLAALATYSTNGIITQTAADTFTGRSVAAGVGVAVTNGDGVAGNPTVAVDINGLTADGSPVGSTDYVATYDASAGTLKKVLLDDLPGGGGGSVATDAIWDTKGDLAVATGANTAVKVPVGTNGHVLVADSAETAGVKWAAPSGGSGDVATDTIWDTAGDLAVGTGADTAAKLAKGAKLAPLTSTESTLSYMYPKWGAVKQVGMVSPKFGANTATNGEGICGDAGLTTSAASSALSGADGLGLRLNTSSTINTNSAVHYASASATLPFRLDLLPRVIIKFALESLTDIRVFIGACSDTTIANVLAADDPTGVSVGLQYSTARSDTNFQFSIDDNTTHTVHDTGVSADTAVHYFEYHVITASSIKLALYDSSFNLEYEYTFTSDLPPSSTGLLGHTSLRTLASAAKNLKWYNTYMEIGGLP